MEQNTALLVMDMQAGILGMFDGAEALAASVAKAVNEARKRKIPVIYVTVAFRQGAPEINMNNKSFASMGEMLSKANMVEFSKVHPAIAPQVGDIVVAKRRVSAFTGSDLEVVLRSLNIQRIVLTGIATSGVVLSTTREAADKDYQITILSDGCADRDEEVHRVLTQKVFPRQAEVLTIDEWCEG